MTRLQKPKHLQIELQLTDTLEQETFPIQNFAPHPKEHHIEPKKTSKITHMNPHEIPAMNPHLKPLPFSTLPSSPPGFQKMHCSSTVQTALKMRI